MSELETIEARLKELKARITEHEQTMSSLWIEMVDLRSRRAVLKHLSEEENGNAE